MLPVVHPARAAGRAAADLAARPGSAAPIAGSDFFTFITPPPAPHVRCVRGAAATLAAIHRPPMGCRAAIRRATRGDVAFRSYLVASTSQQAERVADVARAMAMRACRSIAGLA